MPKPARDAMLKAIVRPAAVIVWPDDEHGPVVCTVHVSIVGPPMQSRPPHETCKTIEAAAAYRLADLFEEHG